MGFKPPRRSHNLVGNDMTGNNAGCWTCRLRRKKCDEVHPICGVCAALEICCYSNRRKPEWMDNGAKQREMVQQLKVDVKRSATRRRSRKLMQRVAQDLDGEEKAQTPVPGPDISLSPSAQGADGHNLNEGRALGPNSLGDATSYSNTARVVSESSATDVTHPSPDHLTQPDSHRLSQRLDNELELGLVMVYLDYTFPILFPFYRPTIFEGGRGWLLVVPMKIRALYHTIISLTSYFFSNVPISSGPAYANCATVTFGEQSKQTDLAVKMVQQDLHSINSQGVDSNLLDSVYLLESIVQLLIVDGVVATSENWRMHLDAAIVVFEQIIQPPRSIFSVLNLMNQLSSLPARPESDNLWTADQSAFRFFSAILLVADIISGTALEQPPKLHKFHHDLLTNDPHFGQNDALQLEDFIGCQNWVLRLIRDIAGLDAWKKDMKKNRCLSLPQLVKHASIIEQELQTGFSQLDSIASAKFPSNRAPDMFPFKTFPTPETINIVTRIWALAARIYLHTVLSGWQTAAPEVCEDVSQTIALFNKLSSPGSLRALAWPFCVAGCLADVEQESAFREIVSSMGPLRMLGTMQSALCIMENVWRKRAHIDSDTWDIAACLRSLGYVVLFI